VYTLQLTCERDSRRLTSIPTLRTQTRQQVQVCEAGSHSRPQPADCQQEEEQWVRGIGKKIANKFRFYLVPNNSANLQIPPHTNAEFHIRALYSEGTGYVPNFVPNFGDPMRTNVPALRAAA